MATPSYPQEDKQERRAPCLVAKLWVWKEDEGTKFLQHFKDRPREQRNDRIMPPCQLVEDAKKHCDIMTLWHVCGYSQLPSDEAKRRHNANSLYMKLMMLKSTSFFWGGTWNSLVRFHHDHAWHRWDSSAFQCPSHRERAASKEFRSISIPGRVTSEAVRHVTFFVFLLWQKMDHVSTTPWENAPFLLEPKKTVRRFRRWFIFLFTWMIFGSVFVFGGVTNNPSNPWGIPRSWMHQTHVYAILRSKSKSNTALLYTNKMKQNCSMDFKTSEVWYVSKGKNTTRSWSVGSSNWVPPDLPENLLSIL